MKPGKSIKIFINYFLAPVLFCWLVYSIYRQILHQPDLERSWQHIRSTMGTSMIWNLLAVCALMIVNWSLETIKWRLSVRQIQEVNFFTAFKAVLSGVSFSVSTPNRIGEYLGRILYMKEGNRLKAISLTITSSISQLIITLVMGLVGILLLKNEIEKNGILTGIWIQVLLYGVLGTLIILTLFYFRLPWLVKWVDKLPANKRFSWLIVALEHFNATLLLQLLSLSLLRFLVFILQYYLLFRLFGVEVSLWQGWWAVSVAFLVMAIIPTIALFTDLGLRGQVNIKLIGLFSGNHLGIGLTSVSIWFINLIIPALVGSLLILSIKKIRVDKT